MATSDNKIIRRTVHPAGSEIALVLGDITLETVDAIVNAANSQLQHGGGVAAAISRRGGPVIQQESNRLAPVRVGEAVITRGGELPAQYVIHTVGPRWGEGNETRKLKSAVRAALDLATREDLNIETVSLPAISTGIYAFPVERAADIILDTIRVWLGNHTGSNLKQIRICLFDRETLAVFCEAWKESYVD